MKGGERRERRREGKKEKKGEREGGNGKGWKEEGARGGKGDRTSSHSEMFAIALRDFKPPAICDLSGKKKAYTALLQCRTFLCRKKWGPQRKDFGGGHGFPGFYRVFVSTTGLESFSF